MSQHEIPGEGKSPASTHGITTSIAWITPRRAALIVAILSFILYILTMNRTFGFVDKGELVAVGSTLGIAHPTGYPTIMLLGYLFTKILPMRSVLALNTMAALLTAIGAGMFTLLVDDLIARAASLAPRGQANVKQGAKGKGAKKESGKKESGKRDASRSILADRYPLDAAVRALYAGLGGLFLACTATWWNQANGFEVYSLHALMMPLVSLLFLRYVDEEREREASASSDDARGMKGIGFTRRGFWFALALGLSFTNHLTTVLLAPAFLVYYFWSLRLNARAFYRLLFLAPPFILGLLPYIWLPIRASMHPQFNWGDPSTLTDLMRHVTGSIYQTYMFEGLKNDMVAIFGNTPGLVVIAILFIVLAAILIGLARINGWLSAGAGIAMAIMAYIVMMNRYKVFNEQTKFFLGNLPAEVAYIGLALALFGAVTLALRSPMLATWTALLFMTCILYSGHYDIMEIGPYYMTAIFAVGIWCTLGLAWLHGQFGARPVLALGAVLVALNCWTNFEASDESGNTLVEDMTVNILEGLPKNSIIFSGQWDFWVAGSFYMNGVEKVRPDVLVIDPELLRRRWYVDELTYLHPEFMRTVTAEAENFKKEVYKFDNDLAYDPNMIQSAYVGLMNAMIDRNIAQRPVCVTGEVDPAIGARYVRTPYHLTLRLMPDTSYLPEEFPRYRFAFWDHRIDGYTAKTYELYARSALARALYEGQYGRDSLAMRYYNLSLGFDPGFTLKEIPSLPLNSEEQVTGMMGFFEQVRGMKRQ
jgi:hypothetical protein